MRRHVALYPNYHGSQRLCLDRELSSVGNFRNHKCGWGRGLQNINNRVPSNVCMSFGPVSLLLADGAVIGMRDWNCPTQSGTVGNHNFDRARPHKEDGIEYKWKLFSPDECFMSDKYIHISTAGIGDLAAFGLILSRSLEEFQDAHKSLIKNCLSMALRCTFVLVSRSCAAFVNQNWISGGDLLQAELPDWWSLLWNENKNEHLHIDFPGNREQRNASFLMEGFTLHALWSSAGASAKWMLLEIHTWGFWCHH